LLEKRNAEHNAAMDTHYRNNDEHLVRQEQIQRDQLTSSDNYRSAELGIRQGQEARLAAKDGAAATQSNEGLDDQISLARTGMPSAQIVRGWGKDSGAQWKKIESGAISQIMAENPSFSRNEAANQFADKQLTYRASGIGKSAEARTGATITANMEIASTEARSMISIARELADKVPRSEFPNLNAISNAVQKGVGGVEIVKLNTSLNSLINSYARAINPRGVPTVQDKEHAREIVNSAYAKDQLNGIFDIMDREMEVALGSARTGGKGSPGGKSAPAGGVTPYSDADKEKRYQDWKKSHAGE
jgi:hypothetical protein